jgi:type II secretory pathway component PulK
MPLPVTAQLRRTERGLSIVLALLVLFVLLVLIFQVMSVSIVELDQAGYYVASSRMQHLAEASRLKALSVLLMDVEDAEDADPGGGGGLAGGLGGGGGGDGGGEDSGANITINTDSLLDEWMNPTALMPAMGEGWTLFVEVVDEDSKVNLMGLWTEDEELREGWSEVVQRLLDKAFEGTSLDLSTLDARDITDSLDDWVRGDRGTFERQRLPPLKTSIAEDEASDSELDTDIIENEMREHPLTLGELAMIEGVRPEHLRGFVEDDVFYPGLIDYLTIWSELELKPEQEPDDDFAGSVFSASAFDDDPTEAELDEEEAAESAATASPTAGGRVNVNTAPLLVLRALAPEDIPTAFLERVVEFRNRIQELRTEFEDGALGDSIFGAPDETDGEEGEEGEEEDDENDPTRYVFETENEVFSKVESEWDLSVFTDDEDKSIFVGRLGVISNVFTVKILLFNPITERRASFRTVVWRMITPDRARIVTLLPLEQYEDPRRMVDFPEELGALADKRFDVRDDLGQNERR